MRNGIYQRIRRELFKHSDNPWQQQFLRAVTELEREDNEKRKNAQAKYDFIGTPTHIVCHNR